MIDNWILCHATLNKCQLTVEQIQSFVDKKSVFYSYKIIGFDKIQYGSEQHFRFGSIL